MNTASTPNKLQSDVEDQVLAWWLDIGTLSQNDWAALANLLQPEETNRAQRFHFLHDQQSYIAAHAVARALLTRWTSHDASAWRFTIGEFGKPEVISPPDFHGLRINLSHTRGMVAAALTRQNDIGVDVEWLERKCDIHGLASQVFAAEEQTLLQNTPDDQKSDVFFALWTLKESYIKAIGKGLSQPLNDFYFDLDPAAIHFKTAPAHRDKSNPATWKFHHACLNDRHRFALAVHHQDPSKLAVHVTAAPLDWIVQLK